MAGLNFEDKPTVFVFPGQEDVAEDRRAKVALRPVNFATLKSIMDRHSTKKVEYHKDRKRDPSQRHEFVETDDDGIFDDSWDYCIVNWENIDYGDQQQLACTRENKILLIRNSAIFLEYCQMWREELEADERSAEGNS